jgi:hypothetical protein
MKVDLPPMFGPVMIWNQESPWRMTQSLGMKLTPSCASTHGCRLPTRDSSPPGGGGGGAVGGLGSSWLGNWAAAEPQRLQL